jgi:hypothetical protein
MVCVCGIAHAPPPSKQSKQSNLFSIATYHTMERNRLRANRWQTLAARTAVRAKIAWYN